MVLNMQILADATVAAAVAAAAAASAACAANENHGQEAHELQSTTSANTSSLLCLFCELRMPSDPYSNEICMHARMEHVCFCKCLLSVLYV